MRFTFRPKADKHRVLVNFYSTSYLREIPTEWKYLPTQCRKDWYNVYFLQNDYLLINQKTESPSYTYITINFNKTKQNKKEVPKHEN